MRNLYGPSRTRKVMWGGGQLDAVGEQNSPGLGCSGDPQYFTPHLPARRTTHTHVILVHVNYKMHLPSQMYPCCMSPQSMSLQW